MKKQKHIRFRKFLSILSIFTFVLTLFPPIADAIDTRLTTVELSTINDANAGISGVLYYDTDLNLYRMGMDDGTINGLPDTSTTRKTNVALTEVDANRGAYAGVFYWELNTQSYYLGTSDRTLRRYTGNASCSDGIKNQDEDRVDCGGSSCSPCPVLDSALLLSTVDDVWEETITGQRVDGTGFSVCVVDGGANYENTFL
ncbi:hypothetical protein HN954_02235 [bacterium]|jgi:hypothetical protein|nr:hypothetical protein [bacterium]MBT6831587.1 hypothetical protein [bacterium]MBT6996226.1 hypothetical protein [bacterium]MBT7772473.1 hypothetical protein [bacterium]